MAKKTKVYNPDHIGAKEVFGVTAMSSTTAISGVFIGSLFLQFMTDYAGLGAWGTTALATILTIAKIIDAVDDPFQASIMDSAKPGKHGKYKKFYLMSILFITAGMLGLFLLPDAAAKIPALLVIWILFFYFLYDMGTSFGNANVLYRSMTEDANERAKLLVGPRIWNLVIGVVGSASTIILVRIYKNVGNYKSASAILVAVAMLAALVISLIGYSMVHEKHVVQEEKHEKAGLKEFFSLFKANKAMDIMLLFMLFHGFIWNFLFATPVYYVKWAYCANLTTGEVDMGLYGTYSLISSMMMLVPLIIGTVISTPIMKKLGTPIRMQMLDATLLTISGAIMFIGQITGLLAKSPVLFFVSMFISATAIGMDFVPAGAVNMEVMDYTIYKTGKDRSALTTAAGGFLSKIQSAVATGLVGAILVAVGYVVDSNTGNYLGDLSTIPTMLNWFIIIMGFIPMLLALVTIFILRRYPITGEEREKMHAALKKAETESHEMSAS